jgi:hypothetical protein
VPLQELGPVPPDAVLRICGAEATSSSQCRNASCASGAQRSGSRHTRNQP